MQIYKYTVKKKKEFFMPYCFDIVIEFDKSRLGRLNQEFNCHNYLYLTLSQEPNEI